MPHLERPRRVARAPLRAARRITTTFTETMLGGAVDRSIVERLHRNAVETRHLALPMEALLPSA